MFAFGKLAETLGSVSQPVIKIIMSMLDETDQRQEAKLDELEARIFALENSRGKK